MYGTEMGIAQANANMFGMMNMMPTNPGNSSNFTFFGNSISLISRLSSLTDEDISKMVDANIRVTGSEIKGINMCCITCTAIWGGILIFPMCFMCCGWWKKCAYPAYDVNLQAYGGIARIIRGPNIKNVTLNVVDNLFDQNKAITLYNAISSSRLQGFTFVNTAMAYNYNGSENSDFIQNMKPIKQLPIMSDIRWQNDIVM